MRRHYSRVTCRLFVLTSLLCGFGLGAIPARAQQDLVAEVVVEGNEYISRDAILDAVKDVLRVGDPYTAEAGRAARTAVMNMGYFEDVTVSRQVQEVGVQVVITVVERKRIERIDFVGNTVVDDSALLETIFSKVGHVVDYTVLRRDAERIESYYQRQGYIARVARANVDDFGVLTFLIEESRIEKFLIEGLKKTEESVVRRMLRTKPGELYNIDSVQRDMQRVFNLGIFDNIRIELRPGEEDPASVIVVLMVDEKRTGMLSLAAAYSELDQFVFMVSLAENNFRGRAQRISLDLEAFGRTSYDVRFFEPFLDDRDTALDLSLFDTERRRRFVGGALSVPEDDFQERRQGAMVRLSRPVRENERAGLRLRTEKVSGSTLQAVKLLEDSAALGPAGAGPGDSLAPITVYAPLHPGGRVTSVGLEYVWDHRDVAFDPREGSFRMVSWEHAGGLLGGDSSFDLLSVEQRFYFPIREKRDVIAVRLLAGTAWGNLPLFESWNVGGSMTLRGYRQDRFRGEHMVLGNIEYRYRLNESLGLVAFIDAGDAFGGTFPTAIPGFNLPADDQTFRLHVGYGVGVRAMTPLGPIRIDYALGEERNEIHFGFGQVF